MPLSASDTLRQPVTLASVAPSRAAPIPLPAGLSFRLHAVATGIASADLAAEISKLTRAKARVLFCL